jgi:hypothetical protein
MRRKYSQIKDLEDGEEQVRELYDSAVEHFSKQFKIPKEDFPPLKITSGEHMAYNQVDNLVSVGNEEFISTVGGGLGEELGHYVRAKVKSRVGQEVEEKEAHSDEFFGFLGRKVLYRMSKGEQRESFFSEGEPTFESNYEGKSYSEMKRKILKKSKEGGFPRLRKRYKKAEKEGDKEEMRAIYEEAAKKGYGEQLKSLLHVRPYHFASDTDLDQIEDLEKLYALPDSELRRRFFREDKQYDTDEERPAESEKKGKLEKKLAAMFMASLFAFLVLSSKSITGNIIGEVAIQKSISFIPLAVALICGGFLVYRLVTQK